MEIVLIAIVAVVLGAIVYSYNRNKSFDVNQDGKVDSADAEAAVKLIKEDIKAKVDINKDGKVDVADVKVAATKAKTTAKKTTAKAKAVVKKATSGRGRKPKAK